jgi:hypothetical protein
VVENMNKALEESIDRVCKEAIDMPDNKGVGHLLVWLVAAVSRGDVDADAKVRQMLGLPEPSLDFSGQLDRLVAVCSQCGSPRIERDKSQEHPGVGLCPDCGGGFIVDLRDSPSWLRIVEYHRTSRGKVLDEVVEKLKNVQHVASGSSFGVTFGDWIRTAMAAIENLRGSTYGEKPSEPEHQG